jgi:DeoR/GlpR family transcriptional regulator of sugar metabolism
MTESGTNSGSFAQTRREEIVKLLLEHERVTVSDLAERFEVSVMTVHRDLDALEERGVLRKVRGGATAQPTALYESSLSFRLNEMRAAKDAIAGHAAQRVLPGSSVALDDSTTSLALLPHLEKLEQLTIVTYFASVVEEVARLTEGSIKLVVIGGTYHPKYHAFGGVLAQQGLERIAVDHSFVSPSAVDVERGAFHQEVDQAMLKRTLVRIGRTSTLMADASKFSKGALHKVIGLEEVDHIVVDRSLEQSVLETMADKGLPVEVAS